MNTDVPAGVGAPPLDTTSAVTNSIYTCTCTEDFIQNVAAEEGGMGQGGMGGEVEGRREEGKDMEGREGKERRENFDEYSHPSEHPSFSPHSRMPLASL